MDILQFLYFVIVCVKVEEMMFQLVCDPSGVVVETTIKELVPALVNWGKELDHLLQVLLSHALGSAQVWILHLLSSPH